MNLINRCVIVVKPKAPYLAWASGFGERAPDDELKEITTTAPVFLIPEFDTEEDAREFVDKQYRRIFDHFLEMWMRDPDTWPHYRDLRIFHEWFDIEIHDMDFDLGRGPIEIERYRTLPKATCSRSSIPVECSTGFVSQASTLPRRVSRLEIHPERCSAS